MRYFFKLFAFCLADLFLVVFVLSAAIVLLAAAKPQSINWDTYFGGALFYGCCSIACFYVFGLYNRLWTFAGLLELKAVLKAVTVSTVIWGVIFYRLYSWNGVVLTWILAVTAITGSRFCFRIMREWREKGKGPGKKRVLLVGAGGAGALVARSLQENKWDLEPVGFIDDDEQKQGMKLCGLEVMGTRRDIPDVVRRGNVREIIITMPSAPKTVIKELVSISQKTPARLKIIPSVLDYIGASAGRERLRDVDVEDLLGREPVQVNLRQMAGYLKDKVVLVTGAGGSIGSELCRQIAGFDPGMLVLLGHGENSIFEIKQHLAYDFPGIQVKARIADVKDRYKIEKVFNQHKPQVVFHAAAHKHVPLMESEPDEAFKNNVLGTINVALAACLSKSEILILISTDKAVNPSCIMGATKKLAEQVVQGLNEKHSTKLAAVRFGNVLGSRGSVIPLFKKQISRGGPVTVTHPEMARYFMTIPEAVQLVIQAGAMARGGEIFFLDMGKPVKILDLARELISMSGYSPGEDIKIEFTGIRPGEKLREEIWTPKDGEVSLTAHPRIYEIRGNQDFHRIDFLINKREILFGVTENREVQDLLDRFVQRCRGKYSESGGDKCERLYTKHGK